MKLSRAVVFSTAALGAWAETSVLSLPFSLDVLSTMPLCAASCLAKTSAISSMPSNNQTANLCKDVLFQQEAILCVRHMCTIMETLAAQNITNTACNVPLRDRSKQYIVLSLAMGIAGSFTVMARLVFKRRYNLGLDTDDWLTGSLLVTSVATIVVNQYWLTNNGLGRDVWTITL
ncbi:hypothetical protein VHEMI02474 [[Torrubiella] hemipterigena]|uniref:CFEM domain-containing protein n=1 Tax=[Torrubiella] hemipterigena TaxID=1531966 RepID=A0A0A1SPQ0_9HYPO|nr:hypothetical protein VHEMI02474 [[Torrubiella] hemipterigena]